jgi:4-amino-4-deoxy-L-arabinose transferase-like glycosyltransferase
MGNHRRLLYAILLAAFFLRAAWVLLIPTYPISDFKEYNRLAVGLINGQGYIKSDGSLTAYRPPGYPFFLAGVYKLLGPHDIIARLVNILLGVLTCWLTYILTVQLFDQRVALIAAMLIALFPSLIAWSNILASENLFLPLVLCVLISFLRAVKEPPIRWPWLVLTGLLTGICVLIRPAAILIPGILILTLISIDLDRKISKQTIGVLMRSMGIGLVIILVMLVIILPWSIRNTTVFGRFVFVSTDGGIVFLSGQNERAIRVEWAPDEGPMFDQLQAQKFDEVEFDQLAYKLAFQFIRQNPLFEVRLIIHKFINFFQDDVSGITYNDLSALTPLPDWFVIAAKGLAEIYYMLVMGLALASIFLKRYPKDRWYFILVFFIIVWVTLHLAFYGKDRYRLPLTPAFVQFAAVTLLAIWDKRPTVLRRKNNL